MTGQLRTSARGVAHFYRTADLSHIAKQLDRPKKLQQLSNMFVFHLNLDANTHTKFILSEQRPLGFVALRTTDEEIPESPKIATGAAGGASD